MLDGRLPTVADMPRLKYAERIAKESMRLYPPAYGVGREAIQEFELGGYRIPAKAQLFMFQWVTQRDPRFFAEPNSVLSGTLDGRIHQQPAEVCLLPFWRRPARLYRQLFCDDGGRAVARDHRSTISVLAPARPSSEP